MAINLPKRIFENIDEFTGRTWLLTTTRRKRSRAGRLVRRASNRGCQCAAAAADLRSP